MKYNTLLVFFLVVPLQTERLENLMLIKETVEIRLCSNTVEFSLFLFIHLPVLVMLKKLQVSSLNEIAYQGKNLYPGFSERSKQICTICKASSFCRYIQLSTRNLKCPYVCIAIPFLCTDVFRQRIQNDLTGNSANPLILIQSLQQVTCQTYCGLNFLPPNLFSLVGCSCRYVTEELYLSGISDCITSDTLAKEMKPRLPWVFVVHPPLFFLNTAWKNMHFKK